MDRILTRQRISIYGLGLGEESWKRRKTRVNAS